MTVLGLAVNAHHVGLLAAAVGLFALWRRLYGRRRKPPSRVPLQRNDALFSADERAFYQTLCAAAGEYAIFAKMRVSDCLTPKRGASARAAEKSLSALDGSCFDFILCEKISLSVVCALQLSGSSVSSRGDDALVRLCADIGLPLLRFNPALGYSAEALKLKIREAIGKTPLFLTEADGRREPRISNLDDITF